MEVIFKNEWMQIYKNRERYIIRYNSGDLINSIKEIEVTESDARKAQGSDQDAYEIIIKYQNL